MPSFSTFLKPEHQIVVYLRVIYYKGNNWCLLSVMKSLPISFVYMVPICCNLTTRPIVTTDYHIVV